MRRLFFTLIFISFLSCTENKVVETTAPAADSLMDSTTIKMKADTTVKMLDKLEDSINKLRDKAADKAGQDKNK
ncbi:MAG: hypothetical protein WKF35_12955 [Ferruginibacter sp.]